MKIRPEELTENGYVLHDNLGHKELAPFILTYIKKRTKYSVFYYIINFIFLGLVGYFFVQGYNLSDYTFGNRFNHFHMDLQLLCY
ncbi:MAG: hypothetical protein IPH93_17790 [Saprospiraceae bacterium]|nr:hypothetical protein [Saprospiraceae bacterium]